MESLVLDELFDRSQSGQSVVDARVEVVNVASSELSVACPVYGPPWQNNVLHTRGT